MAMQKLTDPLSLPEKQINEATPQEWLFEIATKSDSQDKKNLAISFITDSDRLSEIFERSFIMNDKLSVLKNRNFKNYSVIDSIAIDAQYWLLRAEAINSTQNPHVFKTMSTRDPSPFNRRTAVVRLASWPLIEAECMALLEDRSKNDADPDVRHAATLAIQNISFIRH